MTLSEEIAADFDALIAEHGDTITISGTTHPALVSRARATQQAALGGFVESPQIVARVKFATAPPVEGTRVTHGGNDYRIESVASHPKSPITTLSLMTADE